MRTRDIAARRPRFGYQRIHVMLRREGWLVNRKRVRRLYRMEGLQLRTRNGFTSRALEDWAYQRGVKLDFTHPGKPTENGHIESLNGRLRDA